MQGAVLTLKFDRENFRLKSTPLTTGTWVCHHETAHATTHGITFALTREPLHVSTQALKPSILVTMKKHTFKAFRKVFKSGTEINLHCCSQLAYEPVLQSLFAFITFPHHNSPIRY